MKKTPELGLHEYWFDSDSPSNSNTVQSLLHNIKQGLLRIERMEYGLTQVSHAQKVGDLQSCIRHTCQILQKQFSKGVKLHTELIDIPPNNLDFSKVSQVLTHLLVNANQAIEQSGNITLCTRLQKNILLISVSDDGCGIPSASLGKIFDPLFTTKKDKEETGLGLAISQDICHELGGILSVKSTIGEGSEFVLHLPLVSIHLH